MSRSSQKWNKSSKQPIANTQQKTRLAFPRLVGYLVNRIRGIDLYKVPAGIVYIACDVNQRDAHGGSGWSSHFKTLQWYFGGWRARARQAAALFLFPYLSMYAVLGSNCSWGCSHASHVPAWLLMHDITSPPNLAARHGLRVFAARFIHHTKRTGPEKHQVYKFKLSKA